MIVNQGSAPADTHQPDCSVQPFLSLYLQHTSLILFMLNLLFTLLTSFMIEQCNHQSPVQLFNIFQAYIQFLQAEKIILFRILLFEFQSTFNCAQIQYFHTSLIASIYSTIFPFQNLSTSVFLIYQKKTSPYRITRTIISNKPMITKRWVGQYQ